MANRVDPEAFWSKDHLDSTERFWAAVQLALLLDLHAPLAETEEPLDLDLREPHR